MFRIKFKKSRLELSSSTCSEYLEKLNKYLLESPMNCSPGHPEYVGGKVNIEDESFIIDPPFSFRNKSINVFAIGQTFKNISGKQIIDIEFKSSIIAIIYSFLFLSFFIYIFLDPVFMDIRNLAISVLGIVFFLNLVFARKRFLKDCKTHLDFLKKFD